MGAAGYGSVLFAVRVCGCAAGLRGLRDDWKGFGKKVRRWCTLSRRGADGWTMGRRTRGAAIVESLGGVGGD